MGVHFTESACANLEILKYILFEMVFNLSIQKRFSILTEQKKKKYERAKDIVEILMTRVGYENKAYLFDT